MLHIMRNKQIVCIMSVFTDLFPWIPQAKRRLDLVVSNNDVALWDAQEVRVLMLPFALGFNRMLSIASSFNSASISMVFIICALLLKDHSLIVFSTNFFQPMWYMPLWKKDGIDAIRYSKHPAPPDACDYVHKYFWPFRYNRRLYDTLAPWLINACGKSTGTIFIRFQKCA